MKSNCVSLLRCQIAAQGLLLGFALLTWNSASAQNLVKNPDFEEELGPDNWTIVYTGVTNSGESTWPTECGPDDFRVHGRTTTSHHDLDLGGTWDGEDRTGTNYWNKYALNFCAGHDWLMHAYAKQVITNLAPAQPYRVSAWMVLQGGPTGVDPSKFQVYMEVIGGVAGNISVKTPYVTSVLINGGFNTNAWNSYVVTNTASANGQIEIRLHYNKNRATSTEKWRVQDASYDHVSLMRAGQPEYLPPYKIVSFARTNQDIEMTWETVMNNRYRIQYSTNLSNPMVWLERRKDLDTNIFAIGTTLSFQTNLLSYSPSFNTNAPLFFRIYSESFKP
jgi:hypothetical protein